MVRLYNIGVLCGLSESQRRLSLDRVQSLRCKSIWRHPGSFLPPSPLSRHNWLYYSSGSHFESRPTCPYPLCAANSDLSSKACMAHLAAALPFAAALSTLGLGSTGMAADAGKVRKHPHHHIFAARFILCPPTVVRRRGVAILSSAHV
jgi:hypothetical protein